MKCFSKLSLNPEDPLAVLEAIEYALNIGSWLQPHDLLPSHLQGFVRGVDHVAFSAGIETVPSIVQYQKDHGYSVSSFTSTIASKEFGNAMTIYELKGGSLPLEIMVPIDNSKKYPQHHIAFSIKHEEDFKQIISSFKEPFQLPSFMKGCMENQQQGISAIYLDGGEVRLEFIYYRGHVNI